MKALRNGRTSPAPGSARFVPLAIDHDRWMGSTLLCGIMVGPLLLGATEYDYLHFPAGLALGLWIAMWIIWLWAWLASKVKPNNRGVRIDGPPRDGDTHQPVVGTLTGEV